MLLGKDPHALISGKIDSGLCRFLGAINGLELTCIDAGAADRAGLGDVGFAVPHLDGGEGAGRHAGLAACTFVRIDAYAHVVLLLKTRKVRG